MWADLLGDWAAVVKGCSTRWSGQCHPTLLLGFSQHSQPRLFFLQKVWMCEPRRPPINWSTRFPGGWGDIQLAETSMTVLASCGFNQGQTCAIVSRAHIRPQNSLCETAVHNTPGWHWETQRLFWISFAYLESFRIYSLEIAVWEWGRAVINWILLILTRVLRDASTALK